MNKPEIDYGKIIALHNAECRDGLILGWHLEHVKDLRILGKE